jgi:predicted acyl esterase
VQPWSNGKVGLNGISYYAINQWHVASLQPPHLAAMCIWEGAADWYRDMTRHGGILCTFWENWYDMQVKTVQYGAGERGRHSRVHGELVCGPERLSEADLARNRRPLGDDIRAHTLDDEYHRARSPSWSKVKTPFLSAANWGGQPLHPRGNFEGFVRAAAKSKWLEVHGIEHWTHFYTDYGRKLQLRFFDHFLHGKRNGFERQPRVLLQVRHIDKFVERAENEWPLKRTKWTKFFLDPATGTLASRRVTASSVQAFDAMGDGVTFLTAPLARQLEVTGPSAVKLFVSSSTRDADVFVVLRVFSGDLKEVVFQGAIDPHTPVGQGWLRASHRKLDKKLSTPNRPYHSHDKEQPLKKGEVVELDIEIWPTSIVVPAGYRIALSVRGRDYIYAGPSGGKLSNFKNELTGCGPFLHDDPLDRPQDVFGGVTTLHFGGRRQPYLLLPVIPPARRPSPESS